MAKQSKAKKTPVSAQAQETPGAEAIPAIPTPEATPTSVSAIQAQEPAPAQKTAQVATVARGEHLAAFKALKPFPETAYAVAGQHNKPLEAAQWRTRLLQRRACSRLRERNGDGCHGDQEG